MDGLPILWLMTDERIAAPALLRAARRLPRGSGIVLRHHRTADGERRALFRALRRIARRKGLCLLLAGPVRQARAWGADGAHGRDSTRTGGPDFLKSAPVHNLRELRAAQRVGADFVFLSPLFVTRSHPGQRPLGSVRFAAIARRSPVPVMALGGIERRHRAMLKRLGASGYGAIDSLCRQKRKLVPT